nr:MAG TPA: hypothetical protein [Caudoviricetes sp.]
MNTRYDFKTKQFIFEDQVFDETEIKKMDYEQLHTLAGFIERPSVLQKLAEVSDNLRFTLYVDHLCDQIAYKAHYER